MCQRNQVPPNTATESKKPERIKEKDVCTRREVKKLEKWKLYDSFSDSSDDSTVHSISVRDGGDVSEDSENDDNSKTTSVLDNNENTLDIELNGKAVPTNNLNEEENNPESVPVNDDLYTLVEEVVSDNDNTHEDGNSDNEAVEENLENEDVEELVRHSFTNPSKMPVPGDKIKFLDDNVVPPEIVFAVIKPMFKTMQAKHPGWFNILKEGSTKQTSVNLTGVRWKYVNNEAEVAIRENDNNEDEEQEHLENDHETAFTEEAQASHLHMPMPEVRNLDLVLPLTSTPLEDYRNQPSGRSKSRLSDIRPRGLLPMEFEDSPLGRPGQSRIRDAITRRARSVQKAIFNDADSSDD